MLKFLVKFVSRFDFKMFKKPQLKIYTEDISNEWLFFTVTHFLMNYAKK